MNTNPNGNGFGARVDHLGSDAQKLLSDAKSAVNDMASTLDLKGRVQRNPYGMVAAAVGVGYVLGGGLFTPLTARIVRLGLRLLALPLVKDELFGIAEAALGGLSGQAQKEGERS
jgi:hypothetical protein